ncbi:MAG: replicative DNA helicase [Gammaproteobacteria bacterium]|nr:replicative DNA helicase [Gammaproteobacteria bacterium]
MSPDPEIAQLKLPPQALEAEQSVLGGLMLDNARWEQITDLLGPRDFYRRDHRLIFEAIASLCAENEPADVVTVRDWLDKGGQLDEAGGLAYLGQLASNTPSAANLAAYARIVHERALLRDLIETAGEITTLAYRPGERNAEDIVDEAEKRIYDLAHRGGARRVGFRSVKDIVGPVLDQIDILSRSKNPITGVATGYKDLDDLTSGLQPADLVVIAGRPSMGKTSLALNIAENAAVGLELPVALFSMEMPANQLAMRMLSSLGRINAKRVRTGRLEDDDWPRLTSAVALLENAPIYVDDSPGLTPTELRARSRRLARELENGIGLIIVDYLQLMQTGFTNENRATEVSAITRALKSLAKELNVPLIALSQLNRSLEQRPNKRPVMSDLRESGAIEQDADVILFIYRDEVYDPDTQDKGMAEIIIGKQRNGPTGTVPLTFLGEYTKFENYLDPSREGTYGY